MTALYKLHGNAYLDDQLHDAGTTVPYDGNPGSLMEPVNDEAKTKHAEYADERKKEGLAPLRYAFAFDGKPAVDRSDVPEGKPEPSPADKPKPKKGPRKEVVDRAKNLGGYTDEQWDVLSAEEATAALALAEETLAEES